VKGVHSLTPPEVQLTAPLWVRRGSASQLPWSGVDQPPLASAFATLFLRCGTSWVWARRLLRWCRYST